jgi:D-glycero-alpha-D-manno-heptose 1-phosphate guanylyltransferase
LLAAQMLAPTQPFLVLNGDTFFDVPLKQLEQAHITNRSGWTIALFKADAPDRYGKITIAADGAIISIPPERAAPGDYANGGIYLLSPEALAGLHPGKPASLEQEILPAFLSLGGRCFGLPHAGQFFDIGLPHDYYNAGNFLNG